MNRLSIISLILFFPFFVLANKGSQVKKIEPNSKLEQNQNSLIYLDLMPLQLQYRFEDSNDQTRSTRAYQAYGLGGQYGDYRIEFEISQLKDKTGNQSLNVEESITDTQLSFGYRLLSFLKILKVGDKDFALDLFGHAWIGQTQTEVKTTLLSNQSQVTSDKNLIVGAGGSVIGRIKYFMMEVDFKVLNSKAKAPQDVPVYGIKFGAGIPF